LNSLREELTIFKNSWKSSDRFSALLYVNLLGSFVPTYIYDRAACTYVWYVLYVLYNVEVWKNHYRIPSGGIVMDELESMCDDFFCAGTTYLLAISFCPR